MSRNLIVYGIILKASKIGEIHKGLTLFTPDNGLLQCIAHGAWKGKSRLRAATQLFSYSKLYLYYNPVKKSYKVSDIENRELYEGIRESIKKYYTASLWVEIILKSFGGGEGAGEVYGLLVECLKILDGMEDDLVNYLSVQFIWRFFEFTGFKPELNFCFECSRDIPAGELLYHKTGGAQFSCIQCRRSGYAEINPGIRKYLAHSLSLTVIRALGIKIEQNSIETLKRITYHILEILLEVRLNTLRSGKGLL